MIGTPGNGKKRSITARQAARDVQATILKGEPVVMKKIMERRGYAKATIKNPKNVTESASYKEEMYDFVKELTKQRDRALKALANKDLSLEEVKTLTNAVDTLNKNVQLASGGNTENIGISLQISEEIAKKNGLNKD